MQGEGHPPVITDNGGSFAIDLPDAARGKMLSVELNAWGGNGHSQDTPTTQTSRVAGEFQNISDQDATDSFLHQTGNFSLYSPEPVARTLTSTTGAFSYIENVSQQTANFYASGEEDKGGVIPSSVQTSLQYSTVVSSFSTYGGFGALTKEHQLFTWGMNFTRTPKATLFDVERVYSNEGAFAVIHSGVNDDGIPVSTVGDPSMGGEGAITEEIQLQFYKELTGDRYVKAIYSTARAFAALIVDADGISNGNVIVWGDTSYGANTENVQDQLQRKDIVRIISNRSVFIAMTADDELIGWGGVNEHGQDVTAGAIIPDELVGKKVERIVATRDGFAALTDKGHIYSWGTTPAPIPAPDSLLSEVFTDLFATDGAYLAIAAPTESEQGLAVAWGDTANGGVIPATYLKQSRLLIPEGATFKVASSQGAFVLYIDRKNSSGTKDVYVWGNAQFGGEAPENTVDTIKTLGLKSITSTNGAFAVVTTKGGATLAWSSLGVTGYGQGGCIPGATDPYNNETECNTYSLDDQLNLNLYNELHDIDEVYSIKAYDPLSGQNLLDPSFAAKRNDGAVIYWGGNVQDGICLPEDMQSKTSDGVCNMPEMMR